MAKSTSKKPARKASGPRKASAAKPSGKKSAAKKKTSKATPRAAKPKAPAAAAKSKPAPKSKAPAPKTAEKPAAAEAAAPSDKKAPKGITVVTPKPTRKEASRGIQMPQTEPLLKPGGKWKPLIPSGPSAAPENDQNGNDGADRKKQRLSKRELEKYRKILLAKREELLGDITNMEDEALRSGSGSLSHTPQHMAEQGSDAYDQALSLDLAQVDRNLLKEIDDALKRIDDGTYGFCELTGRRIRPERLEELPWTRFSIEAARERERRSYR